MNNTQNTEKNAAEAARLYELFREFYDAYAGEREGSTAVRPCTAATIGRASPPRI